MTKARRQVILRLELNHSERINFHRHNEKVSFLHVYSKQEMGKGAHICSTPSNWYKSSSLHKIFSYLRLTARGWREQIIERQGKVAPQKCYTRSQTH